MRLLPYCACGECPLDSRLWECEAREWLPLCPACIAKIGGACAGPDEPYRAAREGEPCGAADCEGAK